jgi:hypothetical protein
LDCFFPNCCQAMGCITISLNEGKEIGCIPKLII